MLLQVKKLTSNLDLVKDVMRGEITTYIHYAVKFCVGGIEAQVCVLLGLSEFLLKPTMHFNTLF